MKVRCDEQPIFGERITDEKWDFLLSEDDFDRLQSLMLPLYVEANLTDEKGYYVTNWDMIACNARYALIEYIIEEIVPKAIAEIFRKNIHSIVMQKKLIKITKEAFGVAA